MGAGRFITIMTICAAGGIMAASPAFAGDPPTKSPKDDPSKRICKEQTPTGSRFTRRVCKSAYEWQRDEEYSQTRVDENRDSLRSPDMPGAGHPQ
jgi:hypothetical protein